MVSCSLDLRSTLLEFVGVWKSLECSEYKMATKILTEYDIMSARKK